MRKILFRGKRMDNGKWILGSLIKVKIRNATAWIIFKPDFAFVDGRVSSLDHANVDPEAVGQCTGLKDKNGKWIFEGDIIKSHYANAPKADFIEEVVFHNGRFCALYQKDGCKMWQSLADSVPHHPQDKMAYMEWCEVIGNIHDNPELLEGVDHD